MARIQPISAAQSLEFDALLDVRSPAEFAEDHIPGAINVPVLDDAQRAEVGTLYTRVSPFEARKVGAALIARNIAAHIEQHFMDKPKSWRPLVYCWRGGQRSGAMAHILGQIGWSVGQLQGGYKAYRQYVRSELQTLPARFGFRVLCGPTGSGKSRLLHALAGNGAQVLDLEGLANHRGSLLGGLPGSPQPSQKCFETQLWDALRKLDPQHPVFVEAESRKIGVLSLPDSLLHGMRQADCIHLDAGVEARATLLLEDYDHFLSEPALLFEKLDQLMPLHGRQTLEHWRQLAESREWRLLVTELLQMHYDPAYKKSTYSNFVRFGQAAGLQLPGLDSGGLNEAARRLIQAHAPVMSAS
ncbi:MAG TPA: tRNA 2-selenouridine(34) synthase MnmH [Novimethylophilus sp.]|jgi:tRNA 2-selenouridine synthase|uniref:tRNA 2-selenouridine(34) synthase MnmH n=1 Tax=Novimethylophilus sp. TaxID=2137426 RepID=UPI002F40CDC0